MDVKDLGLDRKITRRNFINGVAVSVGALGLSDLDGALAEAQAAPAPGQAPAAAGTYYPPRLTGLRGQHEGSFEAAHGARDRNYQSLTSADVDTGEVYDLVVVGGGISGLSAAYFYRKALGENSKVLVLDNHDDFGGHAKRNEFTHEGRTYIGYGGTQSVSTPFPYSYLAKQMLEDLTVDVDRYRDYVNPKVYEGMTRGMFFDKEHFLADKTVAGYGSTPWPEFFAKAPLSDAVRADLIRLHTEKKDYLAELTPEAKVEKLKRMSYKDFLLQHAKLTPESLAFFQGSGFRNNMRVDTCPAYTAARSNAAGFAGMTLPAEGARFREAGYYFHFPDGNASIARLLVNRLVPAAWSGPQSMETITTAKIDYGKLDLPSHTTRLRLNSTVVRVQHQGPVETATSVKVIYASGGRTYAVTGGSVVMACFNNIIGYLAPEMPAAQKEALLYASKVPMQYTNVFLRNWTSWKKLNVSAISAPNGYHTSANLDMPVSIGGYKCPDNPEEPIVVHMVRNPNRPGLPRREQNRAGRAEMLATPFSRIELEIRSQLARMLGEGGFDPARDILAITANRWPHGYAYTYDTLGDPDMPPHLRPHVVGRQPFGRVTIANADSGAAAFTNTAIDEAHRAVQEALATRGLL